MSKFEIKDKVAESDLYNFEELNQRQIAERLDISQQSVREHLGNIRKGRPVGRAIGRIRRACLKQSFSTQWYDKA